MSKNERSLNAPEPPPADSDHPACWDMVIHHPRLAQTWNAAVREDMEERDRQGAQKYGKRLRPFNGRDALVDAYQEVLDACVYLAQACYEANHAKDAMATADAERNLSFFTTKFQPILGMLIEGACHLRREIDERGPEAAEARKRKQEQSEMFSEASQGRLVIGRVHGVEDGQLVIVVQGEAKLRRPPPPGTNPEVVIGRQAVMARVAGKLSLLGLTEHP